MVLMYPSATIDDGAQSRSQAEEVASELRKMEVQVFFRSCDVRESREVNTFVSETE